MHKATFWPICLGCEKVKWLLKFYSENNGFHLKYLAHKLIAIAFSHWRMMDSLKAMTFRKFSKHQCNILFTIGRVFKIPRPCTHVDICSKYVHIHPPHRKSFCSLRLMCIFTNCNRSLQTRSLNWPLIFSTLWLFSVWVYHWVFYLWRMGHES